MKHLTKHLHHIITSGFSGLMIATISLGIFSAAIAAQSNTKAPTETEVASRQSTTTNMTPHTNTATLLSVENEFIKINVNNTPHAKGRFSIQTTGGRPDTTEDDNQVLIYGKPTPWTSYTRLLIDSDKVVFGTPTPKSSQRFTQTPHYTVLESQTQTSDKIESVGHYQNIQIKQTLSLYRNPTSKVKDAALITYAITNMDTVPHNVGLTIILDTKLGENDGAPLRLGSDTIRSEKQYTKGQFDDYWLAFDSLENPSIIAQGMFRHDTMLTPPDTVLLANWGSLHDEIGDYRYQAGRSFIRSGETEKDTALAMNWDPTPLKPNETRIIKTLYGVGNVSLSPGELNVGLTAPSELFSSSSREFSAMAFISNAGSYHSHNTQLTLTLPDGLTAVSPGNAADIATTTKSAANPINKTITKTITKTIGQLNAHDTIQVPFKFKVHPSATPGIGTFTLTASSDTLESNTLKRTIDILAPPNLQVTTTLLSQPTDRYPYAFINAQLTNTTPHTLSDIIIDLEKSKRLGLPDYERSRKTLRTLSPGQTVNLTWMTLFKSTSDIATIKVRSSDFNPIETYLAIETGRIHTTPYLEVSDSDPQQDQYVYVTLHQAQNPPVNNQVVIEFDPHYLTLSRTTQSAKLLDPELNAGMESRVTSEKISADPMMPTQNRLTVQWKKAAQPVILKAHFKAIQSGSTSINLYTGPEPTQSITPSAVSPAVQSETHATHAKLIQSVTITIKEKSNEKKSAK